MCVAAISSLFRYKQFYTSSLRSLSPLVIYSRQQGALSGCGPMPALSRMRSRLKRLILALGVGAVIGLIISLIRRLTPPRLTHETGSEQPPATGRLTSSGQEAVPAAASAGQEAAVATRKLKARKHSGMFGGGGNQFAAFVSHAKADASMEARYLQTELEKRTRRRVFLDSDDLRDLSQLTAHVLDSDVIIVVQSANVLSRPYCLLELYTAITRGVPVVGVTLASGSAAHSYSFEESARFLTHLDSLLEQKNPGASQLLTQNGVDMEDCAFVLACTLPKIISTKLELGASRNILQATVDDIAATMRNANLPPLPPKEEWLRSRNAAALTFPDGQHGSAPQHRNFGDSHGSSPDGKRSGWPAARKALKWASVPRQVPQLPDGHCPRVELFEEIVTRLTKVPDEEVAQQGCTRLAARGMGGSGKTVLAAAVARDPRILTHFAAVAWVTFGQKPSLPVLQRLILTQLGGTAPADADEEVLLEALRAAAADRKVLLVIDDAWQVEHERALFCLEETTGSACLLTTRIGTLVKGYFELVS